MQDLYEELVDVEARLKKLDARNRQLCQQNDSCRRILSIPGVGELTATAIVAAAPDAELQQGRCRIGQQECTNNMVLA